MVKPCKVTYGGKEYPIEDYLAILHDGLLDQMVKDGIIDDGNFVQPLKPIEKTEDDISREQTQETEILLNGLADKRRKEGKFIRDGVEYVRNEKGLGELSDKKGEIRFTNEISIPFRYKLVEANTLQPSHQDGIRNSFHFIPEAQPKNRNDKGSLQAEESFANKPRFNELGESTNAYSGAPVVNERNEVIQGNNRSAGLRKGYARGNEEYKNSLINNATKFGFTEEQVRSMESPILVRQVAVSDEGAIEIGNYDVKDLETGGIRRLDPVAITRRMPFSIKGRMAELMFSGDETLNQTIRDNQKKIIEIISPYINQAQRNTIIKDGVLSDVGIKDIEDIAKQFLFDNGSSFLPEIFENLSATQKEGLKRALPYIFSVSPEKGLVQDIQVAIIAINDFNSSGAGSFDGWLAQADMFNEGLTPKDKYSPLEIAIAKLLAEEKTQKGISSVFSEYARAVTDKPADMFEPAKEGKSRAEGVLEIFKVEDNERPSNTTSGEDVDSEQKDKAKEKAEPSERKTINIRTPAVQKKEPEIKIKALSEIEAAKERVKNAKEMVAAIRGAKIDGKGKAFDATLGLPVAIWNGAIETVATAIEAGVAVADAIKRGLNYIQKNNRGQWNKKAYNDRVIAELGLRGIEVNGEDLIVQPLEDKATVELVNGFYSPLEKGIVEAKTDKATGKGWMKVLSGVTEGDELNYTGVKDFLESNADRPISRKELLDYMKNNRIEVVEVVLGEAKGADILNEEQLKRLDELEKLDAKYPSGAIEDIEAGSYDEFLYLLNVRDKSSSEDLIRLQRDSERKAQLAQRSGDKKLAEKYWNDSHRYTARHEALELSEEGAGGISNPTKFSQYQLEGDKENYKEILVTMPSKVPNYTPITVLPSGYDIIFDSRNNTYAVIEENQTSGKSITGRYHNTQEDAVKNAIEVINSQRKNVITGKAFDNQFQSSHFDEPNILVHLRMNTRTDAEGNKVLFIEEVQSDWGQKGKKEGFIDNEKLPKKTFIDYRQELFEKYKTEKYNDLVKVATQNEVSNLERLFAKENGQENLLKTIPTAPFVTDTNSWTKLGLKAALKEAVAQGADKLAWTTGEQQNDRYDLSKSVSKLSLTKDNVLRAYDLNGEKIYDKKISSEKEIEDTFGKEAAQKLLEQPTQKVITDYDPKGIDGRELSGVDLKVGGKGMKGFYGSPTEGNLGIVGNVAKSLFGQEPNTVEINQGRTFYYEETEKGFEILESFGTKAEYAEIGVVLKTEKEAQEYVDKKSTTSTQYSIDITPELKQAVKEGIPLFKSELTQAKERLKEASAALSKLNKNLGIYSDPEQNARALFEYHKALVGLAKAYIKAGVNSVKDFAKELGENLTQEIRDAWNEANGKSKKTLSDFKDVAEKIQAKEEKERLAGKSKRMTTQRLLASSEYSEEFKQAIGEDAIYYTELPNEITEKEAQAIIDIKGDVNAEMAIMDMNNNMKLAIRFKIAQKLIDNYEAEGNLDKAVEIYENIAEKVTDAAQGLQSLSTWPKLSPAAAIHMARKSVKKQYDAKAADAKPKTDKIDKEFKKINKESIQEALENIKNIVEKNTFPSGGAIITELPAGYGQNNKVFTREKYLAAKKSLRGFTFSFAGGVPIEKFIDIAGYHIEATGKDFNKFTRRMKADFGSKIKPYLKDIYAKTRKQLIDSGYDKNLFLSDEDVDAQIAEQEGKVFEEKLKKAIEKKDEKAAKAAIAKLQEISKEDGLWGQYKQSAANRLKNVVLTNIQKDISESAPLEQFTDGLVKNMRAKMAELLPEVTKEKAIQRPDIEVIGDAFKNLEKYKEVWEQTQNEFQEKYQDSPEILEDIDAYFGEILDKPFNDKMLSRAISKGLREMGTTISDIVTKHYTVVDNTKQSLADKLVNDAGLSGIEAEALSKAVQKEFDNIATKKKLQILERMFSKKERKKTEFKTLEQDLIRLTNLGAFRNDNIVQMYGDKMGWPKLTEENVKELERLATIVQKTEDPIKKRKAIEDLLAYQANIKGTSIMEFVTAVWYANILSGYNTQAVNFGANALNTAILFGNLVAQNPKNVKFIGKGLIEGIKRGFLEGREVLRTGYSPIKGKAEIPTLLERKDFSKSVANLPKPILKLVNYASYLKYVRRLMVAADVIFFEGQKEMRAYQQAMKQASLENKENPSLNQFDRAIELVGKSDIQLQNIQERVELEFDRELDEINNSNLSNKEKEAVIKQAEIDKKRRTFDLIEQNRSSDMIRESAEFATQGTYNYPPQGALGAVAAGINQIIRYIPVVRYAIPFTNIIANVANETLNYTPAAFFMLKKGGIVPYKLSPLTEQQRTDLLYKGIIGTTLMSTVFLLTQLKGDDDEPILEITANGTGDYAKNYTLQDAGWQPYSLRFKMPNGEYTGWISYQYSPLVTALGYVGNINDLMKYTDADEETIISLMTTSAGMTTASFFQGTFLTGLDDFASAVLDPRSVGKGQQVMEKILNAGVSATRALLIPNLFSQVSQSVQKITNDYKKETRETIMGKFLQDIPYARDIYFNKINILGDPISPDTDKFYSANKPNKVIDLLIEKKKVFGAINRKAEEIYDITLGKQRALTDEEFFEYSKEKGQFIKNALLEDYDKFSKMTSSEFGKELASIKKKATESARYEISDMGSDLTEIVRYIGGEPKTFKLAPENVAQAVKIASEYKNTPAMVALRKQQVEAYVKVGKLSKQEAEKKASMQINKNANKYAKNMIWLKHTKAEKPQDVLEPK
jgi:hypothetical protein